MIQPSGPVTVAPPAAALTASFGLRRPADRPALGAALGFGALLVVWIGLAAMAKSSGPGVVRALQLLGLLIGVTGTWWLSNTVSHIHIHTALFRRHRANEAFSLFLTAVSGIPQSVWRARHLWHHAGEPSSQAWRIRPARLLSELAVIAGIWSLLALIVGRPFWWGFLPGYMVGLALCGVHGHFEHSEPALSDAPGTSYYGAWYNRLWFNDGYHAEHHLNPGLHWSDLPRWRACAGGGKQVASTGNRLRLASLDDARSTTLRLPSRASTWPRVARESHWPPVLRWLELAGDRSNRLACHLLGWLEQLAHPSTPLQRYLLASHERAMQVALEGLGVESLSEPKVVLIGGGGFPRTLLVLRRMLPAAQVLVLEADDSAIGHAKATLAREWPDYAQHVTFRQVEFDHVSDSGLTADADLTITPLAYRGDRQALYARRRSGITLIHDWLWHVAGDRGVVVSPLFMKRLNVVLAGRDS